MQEAKLTANDGDSGDIFGSSVALDGETCLIGAPSDEEPNGDTAGSAYVFSRSNGSWMQEAKLTANDGDSGDIFGSSVALDGETCLIGAPWDEDPYGSRSGSAYVFSRSDGSWEQEAKLSVEDGDENAEFGESVALDGETALIGAILEENSAGHSAGAAYVFTRSDGTWTQERKLTDDDGIVLDRFGTSVALNDDFALIGAMAADSPESADAGLTYVFSRSDGSWTQETKLFADNGGYRDYFGSSVDLSGDTALIGTNYYYQDGGSAYIFGRSDDTWTQERELTDDDGETASSEDNFGQSVALDDGIAIIGDTLAENSNGDEVGSAYVFTIQDESPPPVGEFENAPTDPDEDGLYEDINGDGTFDIVDVQALFANLNDDAIQNNPDAFDFNGDGQVDVVDVQRLFNEL
jgi:hypothetical protein